MYFGTKEDTGKKKTCNSKIKPHDGEADKPGKSRLDLESSRELVGSLKEKDWIAGTIEKKIAFAEDHFQNSRETWLHHQLDEGLQEEAIPRWEEIANLPVKNMNED